MRGWPVLCLCLTLLTGCTQAVDGTAVPAPGRAAPANLALVDKDATQQLLAVTRTAMEAIFSYAPATPNAQQEAVEKYLTGSARTRIENLLGPVRQSTATVTATVQDLAAADLTESTGRVLVMINQSSTRPGADQPAKAGAAVMVTAERDQDTWRFTELVVNPTQRPIPPSAGDPTAEARDAALKAARSGLTTMMSVDSNDLVASLARQLDVTTNPLRAQLLSAMSSTTRTMREQRVDVKVTPDLALAAKSAERDKVAGLALVKTTVTTASAPQPTESPIRVQFEMARDEQAWKLRSINVVPVG